MSILVTAEAGDGGGCFIAEECAEKDYFVFSYLAFNCMHDYKQTS
jgi:hypothetical protein